MNSLSRLQGNQQHHQRVVDRAQYDLLPIITGCTLGVMLLSLMRDLFLFDTQVRSFALFYYLATYLVLAALWTLRQTQKLPVQWGNAVGAVCLGCIALNPIIETVVGVYVGPLYLAVSLFGGALTVLSFRHLVAVQALIIVIWFTVNLNIVPVSQLLPFLVMNLFSSALGVITLKKRLGTLFRIHSLESRVEALESILPMCAGCKKTRNDEGEWLSVESYIETHEQGVSITHAMCPECMQEYYGDVIARHNLDPASPQKK
jgi:hypothetical protein